MTLKQQLLAAVDKYCKAAHRTRSAVAEQLTQDSRFFDRLDEGKSCTIDTWDRVMAWLTLNTPKPTKKLRART